jgi:hypothetical protein
VLRYSLRNPRLWRIADPQNVLAATTLSELKAVLGAILRATEPTELGDAVELTITPGQRLDRKTRPILAETVQKLASQLVAEGLPEAAYQHPTPSFQLVLRFGTWQCPVAPASSRPVSTETVASKHPASPTVGPRAPAESRATVGSTVAVDTAALLIEEVECALAPIVAKIDAWLATLEGRTFPVDEPPSDIEHIRNVVRTAGCELLYLGQPAQLSTYAQARAQRLRILIRGKGALAQTTLSSTTALPRLSVRRIGAP